MSREQQEVERVIEALKNDKPIETMSEQEYVNRFCECCHCGSHDIVGRNCWGKPFCRECNRKARKATGLE